VVAVLLALWGVLWFGLWLGLGLFGWGGVGWGPLCLVFFLVLGGGFFFSGLISLVGVSSFFCFGVVFWVVGGVFCVCGVLCFFGGVLGFFFVVCSLVFSFPVSGCVFVSFFVSGLVLGGGGLFLCFVCAVLWGVVFFLFFFLFWFVSVLFFFVFLLGGGFGVLSLWGGSRPFVCAPLCFVCCCFFFFLLLLVGGLCLVGAWCFFWLAGFWCVGGLFLCVGGVLFGGVVLGVVQGTLLSSIP